MELPRTFAGMMFLLSIMVPPSLQHEQHRELNEFSTLSGFELNENYGCGYNRGCIMHCPTEHKCAYIISWLPVTTNDGEEFDFEIIAQLGTAHDSWVAVGFSHDQDMGDDSVVECVSIDGRVDVFYSFNKGYHNHRTNDTTGLSVRRGSLIDGVFHCTFRRAKIVPDHDEIFDLDREWYMMFAAGEMQQGDIERKHKHKMMFSTKQPIDLGNFTMAGATSNSASANSKLIQVHASLMIIAWVIFASLGIMTARYYREFWASSEKGQVAAWFQIHRACMALAALCVIISVIVIFEKMGQTIHLNFQTCEHADAHQAHVICGILVFCLSVLNPILAAFRPPAEHRNRFIFNFVHLSVGIGAYCLAYVTMGLGLVLGHVDPAGVGLKSFGLFVVGQTVVMICLEVRNYRKRMLTNRQTKYRESSKFSLKKDMESDTTPLELKTVAPTVTRRGKLFYLIPHLLVTGGFAIAIIVAVCKHKDGTKIGS